MCLFLLATCSMVAFQMSASSIGVNDAKSVANSFLKSHSASVPGSFRAPAAADLRLAHAEASSKVPGTHLYYAFNVNGGGFIIVSGDNLATPVLGYSDKGQIDFNNLPEALKDLLDIYKEEIEYIQTHEFDVPKQLNQSFNESSIVVAPMTKSLWGPEWPYYSLCPMYQGAYSKVGCAGVCMAQMLYFWKFPRTCDALPAYYGSRIQDTVPALPATTLEYKTMLLSYCYWDFDSQSTIQENYTDEQAHEVAKLCRYVGQMGQMNYSPDGSALSFEKSLASMKMFGYKSNAWIAKRDWYTLAEWENLLRTELDLGRPVMYSSTGPGSPRHAFICDGYTNDNYFHMNLGWYGYNNGWYKISAFSFINRYGSARTYNRESKIIIGIEPPLYCTVEGEVEAPNRLLVLGETFNAMAHDVDLYTSYRTLPFLFTLTNADGNCVAESQSLTVRRIEFDFSNEISLPMTLPEALPEGTYDLHLNYRTSDNAALTTALTSSGKLTVVGKFAKYGEPFNIGDLTDAIDYLLQHSSQSEYFNIGDVSTLIDYLLAK